MLGLKINWNSPWTLAAALAGGAALYWVLTGNKTPTGFGPVDQTLTTIGTDVGLEGIFHNSAPTSLKPAPGKTTVVTATPLAGQNTGLYQNVYSGVAFDESRRLSIA